jgi:MFS transporter, SHS family, lactate transporter
MSATAAEIPWYKEPTRDQWACYIACWAGWVLDAFDFTLYLMAAPAIAKEFGVTTTAAAWVTTATLVLRLLGGGIAGWAADRWGRKKPLLISILWFALFDGLIAFAPSYTAVLVLRALFGIGMGAEWAVGTTLAMENWPARSRGIASGVLQGSWAVGYLLAAVVSGLVLPTWGWRALFIIGLVPAVLVLYIRRFVPDSADRPAAVANAPRAGLSALQPYIGRMLYCSVAMVLGFSVYYGLIGNQAALVMKELGLDAGVNAQLSSLFNVGMMGGAVVTGWLFARRGIRWAVVLPATLALFALPLYTGVIPGYLALGALLTGALGAGWSGVTPAFLTAMFPAHIRGTATGIVYHVGAFAAAFMPPLVASLGEGGMGIGKATVLVAGTSLLLMSLWLGLPARRLTAMMEGPVQPGLH